MMYIYYAWSSKATWMSVTEVPFITRTIQAHRVLKSWVETEATTTMRYSSTPNKVSRIYDRDVQLQENPNDNLWHEPYLELDDTDANDCPTGHTTIYAGRPSGFVEIEVTSSAKEWKFAKPNHGLLIWATNEDQYGRDTRFYSKSYDDSTKHSYIQLNCN